MHAHTNREEVKWEEQQPLGRTLGEGGIVLNDMWVGVGSRTHWEVLGSHWLTLWVVLRCMGRPHSGYSC